MKAKLFRFQQYMFCHIQRLIPWPEPEVIQGEGSVNRIPELLEANQTDRVLVITTAGTIRRGTLNPLFHKMKEKKIAYEIFDQVMPNPTIDCIEAVTKQYRDTSCQAIVAIGGGSVLDCAKIVGARVVKPSQSISQMKGMLKIHKKLPDMYLVPTTAGTGSEITVAAVVTDSKTHIKYAVADICLLPKYAILDSELTKGLSPSLTAETGMDALTHAVEAYINRYSDKEANDRAKKAVKMIFDNLQEAYDHGDNMEAREQMLEASFEAGRSFTRAYVGYVHAIAHALGGKYNIAHGLANAVILPVVLEAYGGSAHESLAELADYIGLEGTTTKEKAELFISEIRQTNSYMGLPMSLDMIKDEDIKEMARRACKEANPAYPVPEIWDQKKMEAVIKLVSGK
ncbi:alcohol dehydrogenase [Lachnospiraceae bacterium KM106-2]|nr:alcohol dehydrogenase [Lachnospiraceae bacterium KM106-2]